MTFEVNNPELLQAVRLLISAEYLNDNKLGFKIDPKTGKILNEKGKAVLAKDLIIQTVENGSDLTIEKIFIEDSDHTNRKKDIFLLEDIVLKKLKEKGFYIGVEHTKDVFDYSLKKDFDSFHLADLSLNRSEFIENFKGFLVNKENMGEQANFNFDLHFKCKLNDIPIIFCEQPNDRLESYSKAIKFSKNKDLENFIKKTFSEIDQQSIFPYLKKLPEEISYSERDIYTKQQIEDKKAVILRGSKHELFSNDLDDQFNNSITILNCFDEEALYQNIFLAKTEIIDRFNFSKILEVLKNNLPLNSFIEEKKSIDEFIKILNAEKRSKIDIPDYIKWRGL